MKKIIFALAAFAALAGAQTFSWTGAPASIASGTAFTITLQATASTSTTWSGAGWNLSIGGGTVTGAQIASGLSTAGEDLTCNATNTICAIVGGSLSAVDSSIPIISATQPLATLTITPSASVVTLTFVNVQMVNAGGGAITAAAPPPAVLPNKCAITGDGIPSDTDFETQLQWSLGLASPPSGGPPAGRVATDTMLPLLRSAEIVGAAVVNGGCNATQ